MELYELRNDTCFLSIISQNLTNYAIIPSLASGMLQNFTNCALTLPLDFRHVTEIQGLSQKLTDCLMMGAKYLEVVKRGMHPNKRMVPGRN